jgi:DNA-binding protein HU-beta
MKHSELIEIVAEKTGVAKSDVKKVVDVAVESIRSALASKDKVTISGIGIFSTKDNPAREARNPGTGAIIPVPAKTVVKFKPAKSLSDLVKG